MKNEILDSNDNLIWKKAEKKAKEKTQRIVDTEE